MPLKFEVLIYRQTFGESLSILSSDPFDSREAAEAFAVTQRSSEMKASVYVRCTETGHTVGRTPEGVDFCQQCDRTRLNRPEP